MNSTSSYLSSICICRIVNFQGEEVLGWSYRIGRNATMQTVSRLPVMRITSSCTRVIPRLIDRSSWCYHIIITIDCKTFLTRKRSWAHEARGAVPWNIGYDTTRAVDPIRNFHMVRQDCMQVSLGPGISHRTWEGTMATANMSHVLPLLLPLTIIRYYTKSTSVSSRLLLSPPPSLPISICCIPSLLLDHLEEEKPAVVSHCCFRITW